MAKKKQDPLSERVHRVVDLVGELRREVEGLESQLTEARQRIQKLDEERGTIRQRVRRIFEYVNG